MCNAVVVNTFFKCQKHTIIMITNEILRDTCKNCSLIIAHIVGLQLYCIVFIYLFHLLP